MIASSAGDIVCCCCSGSGFCCSCRGTDTSAKELAGLRSEKEGIQRELSALQSIHAKDSQFSKQEADELRQACTPPEDSLLSQISNLASVCSKTVSLHSSQ